MDINATDLTTGMRFTFSQELFDLICSDLSTIKVARAVTASSAVPVAFPTVVLENHADQCDISDTDEWAMLQRQRPESEVHRTLLEDLKSLRDAEARQYIHLVDGGISDNLGLRAMIDRLEGMGEERFRQIASDGVRNLLVILVNAAVHRESLIEQSADKPGPSTTMSAYISSQMKRFDQETLDRIRNNVELYQTKADRGDFPLNVYFSEVSFDHIQLSDVSSMFNKMPTSLELNNREVDQLIAAGRFLLRIEPSFVRFMAGNDGRLADGAMSENELCTLLGQEHCKYRANKRPAGSRFPH